MKLLVIEDEVKAAAYLRKGPQENDFAVDLAHGGEDGHHLARTNRYDMVIQDVMLSGRDGWESHKDLRQAEKQTPVLFLTAGDSVQDWVKVLELPADNTL